MVKVSKEKTAKFIPNAVGLATAEEKHVFGSLLSRDSTFKFMTHVWKRAIRGMTSPVVANGVVSLDSVRTEVNHGWQLSYHTCGPCLTLSQVDSPGTVLETELDDEVVLRGPRTDVDPSSESEPAGHDDEVKAGSAGLESPIEASYLVKRMSAANKFKSHQHQVRQAWDANRRLRDKCFFYLST